LPFWLETRPANDTPASWKRFGEDTQSLVEAEERARAIIRCKVVTPEGVRVMWSPGVLPRGTPRQPAPAPRSGVDGNA